MRMKAKEFLKLKTNELQKQEIRDRIYESLLKLDIFEADTELFEKLHEYYRLDNQKTSSNVSGFSVGYRQAELRQEIEKLMKEDWRKRL